MLKRPSHNIHYNTIYTNDSNKNVPVRLLVLGSLNCWFLRILFTAVYSCTIYKTMWDETQLQMYNVESPKSTTLGTRGRPRTVCSRGSFLPSTVAAIQGLLLRRHRCYHHEEENADTVKKKVRVKKMKVCEIREGMIIRTSWAGQG